MLAIHSEACMQEARRLEAPQDRRKDKEEPLVVVTHAPIGKRRRSRGSDMNLGPLDLLGLLDPLLPPKALTKGFKKTKNANSGALVSLPPWTGTGSSRLPSPILPAEAARVLRG